MIFSSLIFIFLFLPFTLLAYLLLRKQTGNIILLIGSIIFYFWSEKHYTIIVIGLILVNYWLVKHVSRNRLILILILSINIGVLFYFKYFYFFFGNFVGGHILVTSKHLLLGISFFVFHAISYCLDVYRGTALPTKSLTNFSLYMLFFPQMIAGPIVRYRDIASQLTKRIFKTEWVYEGTKRFIYGLGKKVLIANILGLAADRVFTLSSSHLSTDFAWLGIISYTLQIYFDFSAYSDMAIGLAKVFGFQFLENFNYPYISRSIQEFWTRWHISLSNWFRDYLFIPLGGSRNGKIKTYVNILIVFTLCGIWHGANWIFALWGIYYAFFLIIEHSPIGKILQKMPRVFQHVLTLTIIMYGWVLFRSSSLYQVSYYTKALIGQGSTGTSFFTINQLLSNDLKLALIIGIVFSTPIYPFIKKFFYQYKKIYMYAKSIEMIALLSIFFISIIFLVNNTYKPFIYFRF